MNRNLVFAYPGDLALNTGGYGYDRRVIAGLGVSGWAVKPLALGSGFPMPSPDVKSQAEKSLSELPDGTLILLDGLAFGVLDDWAMREALRLRIVALVHHPLALETGLSLDEQTRFQASERRALSHTKHVIVTSALTAQELIQHYGLTENSITVAVPGTEPAAVSAGDGDPPHIVSIGTLTRRKGHDILLSALSQVADLPWHATIAGSRTLDPRTAAALERQLQALNLGERVLLAGERDDARSLLAKADIFALASRYEGYGMVFAEALSQGVPVVACRSGAVPSVVPDQAGILVPTDDVAAFAQALRAMLDDKALRKRKAEAARVAGAKLPNWRQTTAIIANTLETLP